VTIELAVYYGQQGLLTALWVGGPILITSLVVGSLISILQAVTQIQEVTLVFVPKIIAVFLVVSVAGGWMLQMIVAYATQMFLSIPNQGA
jgi:flagellar biosynthetic protein FliQ